MEKCDLYDIDGNKLNKVHIRWSGNSVNQGEYTLAVDIWIKNSKNQILLTQRHQSKKLYPLKWECTSGVTINGEDSFAGALREVSEEIGIKLEKHEGRKIHKIIRQELNMIFDIFLFNRNIDLKNVKLQNNEVINVKWVEKEELKKMFKNKEMVEPLNYICELINLGMV